MTLTQFARLTNNFNTSIKFDRIEEAFRTFRNTYHVATSETVELFWSARLKKEKDATVYNKKLELPIYYSDSRRGFYYSSIIQFLLEREPDLTMPKITKAIKQYIQTGEPQKLNEHIILEEMPNFSAERKELF